jgi:hypothetical protein
MLIHTYMLKGCPMRVTVHIPDSLGPKLRQAAHNEGISVSALTAKAVEEYLKQRRKKAAGNRLLELIRPGSVAPDAWEELERGRADDRA